MTTNLISHINNPTKAKIRNPIAVRNARVMLLLMIGLLAFSGVSPYLFAYQLFQLAFYSVAFLCVGLIVFSGENLLNNLHGIMPFALWILFYNIWSSAVSENPLDTWTKAMPVLVRGLFFLISLSLALKDKDSWKIFVRCMLIVAIFNAAVSYMVFHGNGFGNTLINTFYNDFSTSGSPERPGGFWINPNEASFAFYFILVSSYWLKERWVWIGRIAAIIGIQLSASRTGLYLLLLYVILNLLFILRSPSQRKRFIAFVYISFAIFIGTYLIFADSFYNYSVDISKNLSLTRSLDITEADTVASGGQSRTDVISAYYEVAKSTPWYGYGYHAFQDPALAPFVLQNVYTGAHNIYLTVYGETGIIGAIFFSILLIVGLKRAFTISMTPKDRHGLLMFWVAYLVIGMVYHNLFTAMNGIIFAVLLYQLPMAFQQDEPEPATDLLLQPTSTV